ncbi:SidA/IucD/PvdA family monooxygenase [Candidatus Uabimicrobium amorphum]|uniref:Lysine 6-monooxygenase n=1 Tax=Uabimicrobium amorphum TaxID=2596890 RepID=A0A5S9IVC7_UABAM|nr:SidA/IucD/PvdA family monooxygenase [Candidatus Uabimicrobium amorphum]BBM87255.1 lysine 6-monooxygenase [Candidatus Uabimicrobium amorphum]
MQNKTLGLIGGGPKSLAIAAKNKVLRQLGFDVPNIILFEKEYIGFNWAPRSGLTSGDLPLGTSPLKDIGFPYYSFHWGEKNPQINTAMLEYSWQNFLIETYQYSDWVDRGQPSPLHNEWFAYLNWVFDKLQTSVDFVNGEVAQISYENEQWKITAKFKDNSSQEYCCDGIVATGPGNLSLPQGLPEHPRIFTATNFWQNYIEAKRKVKRRVALIGTGENAATIAIELGKLGSETTVEIISPNSMSYSRGESYLENHVYTDPIQMNWHKLTYKDKKDFINRTDRGVFSLNAKEELNVMKNIKLIPGFFQSVAVDNLDQLVVELIYNDICETRIYDTVVIAMGFAPWKTFMKLLNESAQQHIAKAIDTDVLNAANIEAHINEFLAVDKVKPYLHFPMLAGINQGPGFPNLSSLGRLSDHVLTRYIPVGNFADLPEKLYLK